MLFINTCSTLVVHYIQGGYTNKSLRGSECKKYSKTSFIDVSTAVLSTKHESIPCQHQVPKWILGMGVSILKHLKHNQVTHTQITSNNHPYIDICINKIKPSKNIYKQDRWPPNKKRKPPTVPHHPHHEHHEQALLDSTRSTWWLPSLNNLEAVSQLSIQSLNLKSHKLQQIRGDIGLNFSQQ